MDSALQSTRAALLSADVTAYKPHHTKGRALPGLLSFVHQTS